MSYSRRQLEAFGEPLGESVTREKPGGRIYGGGGGGPSSTTVTQSNIPDWLRPQVESLLGGATKEFFRTQQTGTDSSGKPIYEVVGTKPYIPYSTRPEDYVAGFSPLQQQVQYNAANLQVPGQFGTGTQMAELAGSGALGSADTALGYGSQGAMSGMMGQQFGLAAAQRAAQQAALAQSGAYGYGQAGYGAGLRGEKSGQLGQQIGTDFGQFYGTQAGGYGQMAAGLAPEAQAYGQAGAGYGATATSLVPQAQAYGQRAADIGQMGLRAEELGRDITGQARGYSQQAAGIGGLYERLATSPAAYQAYMTPYQQKVTDLQVQAAQRQADIARQARKSQAARAGAYGGARQAIEEAEAQRALQSQLQGIEAQGLQSAYQQAQANILQRAQLEAQGLAGAQSGLGTALQGGQLGLSGIGQAMAGQQAGLAGLGQAGQLYGLGMQGAGVALQGLQGANQLYQTGIQGAGMGLQGVDRQLAGTAQGMQGAGLAMQGAGMGLQGIDRALASGQLGLQGAGVGLQGTAQGMQGAQVGLQGVQGAQAGYGLANQAAGTLGQLGTQQLAAQTGILGLQNQIGAQQQQQQQQIINQAIQNYAMQQEAPYQAMSQFNALLRGYAVPGQTTSMYQAQPALGSQLAGLGTAGLGAMGLYNTATRKKGGTVMASDGIDKLALRNALAGA